MDASHINLNTSILDDLQIKGDDVDELFGNLIKDFAIEVKELNLSGFNVGTEPLDLIGSVINRFKKVQNKPTITIDKLLQFINTGTLS